MEDKKDASKTELKLEKKNEKVKKEWTLKRVLTTVIIAVLALLMVGGSFYYIFSPGFKKDYNAFGYYDGEPVLYESNNVFGRTLMSDEDYATAATSGDYSTMYTSWYKAYQSEVVYIALSKMAAEAGMLTPQKLVNDMIVKSGVYNDENGEFDIDKYNETSDLDKKYFYNYIQDIYPFQTVLNDVYTALTSAQEKAFVTEVGSQARKFDYFVVGPNVYPDELASDYFAENRDFFKLVDISMISCSSEDSAKACIDEMKNGLSWEDAVAKYSGDSYASNGGKIGSVVYVGAFEDNMANKTDTAKILALNVGEYTDPIEGPYSWSIYKLNSEITELDLDTEEALDEIKHVVYEKNADAVKNYIDEATAKASEYVKYNFEEAAELFGEGLISVGPVTNNVSGSSVLAGLDTYDSNGYLAEATTSDKDVNKALFSEAVGYIAGPIETDHGYLFAKVVASSEEESLGQITSLMYNYYVNQFDVVDVQSNIISSEKHQDNFTTKFIELFLGESTN